MLDLHARTTSAWDALSGPEFLNPDFIVDEGILRINLAGVALRPWVAYYCRGCEATMDEPQTLLESRCARLIRENEDLRRELEEAHALLRRASPRDILERDDADAAISESEMVMVVPAPEPEEDVATVS